MEQIEEQAVDRPEESTTESQTAHEVSGSPVDDPAEPKAAHEVSGSEDQSIATEPTEDLVESTAPEPDSAVPQSKTPPAASAAPEEVLGEEFFSAAVSDAALNVIEAAEQELQSLLEAIVYITDEPLSAQQIAAAIERPLDQVQKGLDKLVERYEGPGHGLTIRELAGGYKMGTKPEHHESMRTFVKKMKPPLKLSLAALETLAVIAYKQPATGPEIMEIRGVQGGGVMKTLLDRKLIASAGRKNVVGKPMMYKTTREFLLQFGLKDLAELPTLKEFEELKRLALSDPEADAPPTDVEGPATPEEAAAATADRGVVGEGNERVDLEQVQANAEPPEQPQVPEEPQVEEPLPHPVPPKEEPPEQEPPVEEPGEEVPQQDPPADEDQAPREDPPKEEQ